MLLIMLLIRLLIMILIRLLISMIFKRMIGLIDRILMAGWIWLIITCYRKMMIMSCSIIIFIFRMIIIKIILSRRIRSIYILLFILLFFYTMTINFRLLSIYFKLIADIFLTIVMIITILHLNLIIILIRRYILIH